MVEARLPGTLIEAIRYKPYLGLGGDFKHEMVDHAVEYVVGRVSTNGIENFWSLLKRSRSTNGA